MNPSNGKGARHPCKGFNRDKYIENDTLWANLAKKQERENGEVESRRTKG
jgi:hypothetical protein